MQRFLSGFLLIALSLACFPTIAAAEQTTYRFPFYDTPAYQNRLKKEQQAELNKKLQAELKKREARQKLLTEQLFREVSSPEFSLRRVNDLIKQGANPVPILPIAAQHNNPRLLESFYSVKKDQDWSASEDRAVRLAMKSGKVLSFDVLVNKGVSCPQPYDLDWRDDSSRWHPVEPAIIQKLVTQCYDTQSERDNFVNDSLIRLNPGDHMIFRISENVDRFVAPQNRGNWLASIYTAIKAGGKVKDLTLFKIVSESRVETIYKKTELPFETTRQLVLLSLSGGANGKAVLKQLDNSDQGYAWEHYSSYERNRLSNLLEGKAQDQSRSLADSINLGIRRLAKQMI